jgi:hypothetical protein
MGSLSVKNASKKFSRLGTFKQRDSNSYNVTSINDTGGKFATGVYDTGGKQWEQLSDC